ncbi:putative ribonuclease H-like domain-containing protein [Tanacetum coccineum]
MRPFGCPITILNNLDRLGKFDGKADKGFFIGYSVIIRSAPNWLFDIDSLTISIEIISDVFKDIKLYGNAGTKESIDAGQAGNNPKSSNDEVADDAGKKSTKDPANESDKDDQEVETNINSTNSVSVVSSSINTARTKDVDDDPMMPNLEDTGIFGGAYDDEDFVARRDMNNLQSSMLVSPIATIRVHKDHPVEQIIRDLHLVPQTRRMTKNFEQHVEPKKVWTLVDLPYGKRAIGIKWVYRNKKDELGIVVRNKGRLIAQGYTQEEGIDYDEVFALVARIKEIRLFLAYASFMNFVVYQMDVKSAFLYGKIEKEVYVCQPLGFEDPEFPNRVYKVKGDILLIQVYVDDIIFQSTKKKLCTEFEKLMHKKFQMSSMGELTFFLGLQVMQKEDGIFISQDEYVDEILKKFGV